MSYASMCWAVRDGVWPWLKSYRNPCVFDLDMEQWYWWNPTLRHYQPCEGMTEEQIPLPTIQDKTAIVSTREENKAVYPTLDALFQRSSTKRKTIIHM